LPEASVGVLARHAEFLSYLAGSSGFSRYDGFEIRAIVVFELKLPTLVAPVLAHIQHYEWWIVNRLLDSTRLISIPSYEEQLRSDWGSNPARATDRHSTAYEHR
jgi:hypothetical protein